MNEEEAFLLLHSCGQLIRYTRIEKKVGRRDFKCNPHPLEEEEKRTSHIGKKKGGLEVESNLRDRNAMQHLVRVLSSLPFVGSKD